LAEQDPSNADWQRDLALAQSCIGNVMWAQGRPSEAEAAIGEYLTISRRLAEQLPDNADWQRELAVAYWNSARLESEGGRNRGAIPLYEEASRIFSALLNSGSGSAEWAMEKEAVDSELRSARMNADEG
jgi:hypothetical protein